MAILEKLGLPAPDWRTLDRDAKEAQRRGRLGQKQRTVVRQSGEMDRILALPRRAPVDLSSIRAEALVEIMTARLRVQRRGPCDCALRWGHCIDRLLPIQAWALFEMPLAGGLFGKIGAGAGKTVIDILAPMVMRPRLAVLCVPPGLTQQLWIEYQRVAEHFVVPSIMFQDGSGRGRLVEGAPPLHVVPYSILQMPSRTTLLRDLNHQGHLDLLLLDEAHMVRNVTSARGNRILDHMQTKPETSVGAWTGSFLKDSIRNIAHFLAFSLGDGSPLPQHPVTVSEWADAVDPSATGDSGPPGALLALMAPGEGAREAVRRRISETLGVVETRAAACDASIRIAERKTPPMPQVVADAIHKFRYGDADSGVRAWTRPDGEELTNALDATRVVQQLACGFYYRWIFPRGESPELVAEWKAARKAWNRELRQKLQQPTPHLDSPFLCAAAAARFYRGRDDLGRALADAPPCAACAGGGRVACACVGGALSWDSFDSEDCRECHGDRDVACPECGGSGGGVYLGALPTWAAETWPAWSKIKDAVYHETEPVWVDDYLARDAAAWALTERGVLFYEHDAFGKRVAELSGLPLHGGGPGAEAKILAERGDRSVVASIHAHGTGRDGLQRIFWKMLLQIPPASADKIEQVLARLHRIGQGEDTVEALFYRHVPELRDAIDKSVRYAKFVQGISGNLQKILAADCDFIDEV